MGIFTQNHYNLLKLQSFAVFNSCFNTSNQVTPTIVNDNISINFQRADRDEIKSFSSIPVIHFGSYQDYAYSNYYSLISTFYSAAFNYGDNYLSGDNAPNMTFIKFITTDFEEHIDNQYFGNLKGYKAVSEQIHVLENGCSVDINYTRSDTTPLYGIQLITSMRFGQSTSTRGNMDVGTYIHKFETPISDTSFTITISYNITNGELNVN